MHWPEGCGDPLLHSISLGSLHTGKSLDPTRDGISLWIPQGTASHYGFLRVALNQMVCSEL